MRVTGYQWAGIACGLKESGKPDMALVLSDAPCEVAGIFTINRVKAAPVLHGQRIIEQGQPIRAVLTNAGNANACTGQQGHDDVAAMAAQAAGKLGCQPHEVMVLSTGVIGVPLPMDTVQNGIDQVCQSPSTAGYINAANAIMTTDTHPKIASIKTEAGYTITGIAKGSGMIAPDMATMLAVIVTDAEVEREHLREALRKAGDASFNRIVVDGDMSTNDTVLALANGEAGVAAGDEFAPALEQICTELAHAIVRDGEGATKFVTVHITGAATIADAQAVGRAIATSPLCKTAFYGADPNWGRILAAAGRAGVPFDDSQVSLWLTGDDASIQLVAAGTPSAYDEHTAAALMQGDTFGIRLDLDMGEASVEIWTCDLSPEYVHINGHYRT